MKTHKISIAVRKVGTYVNKICHPKPNYSNYIKISDNLPDESYNLIYGIKSVIGNFAKKNRLVLHFNEVPNKPTRVRLKADKLYNEIISVESLNLDLEKISEEKFLYIPKSKRLKNLTLNLDTNTDESPIRTVYKAVSEILFPKNN